MNAKRLDKTNPYVSVWRSSPIMVPLAIGLLWWKRWLCLNCGFEDKNRDVIYQHLEREHSKEILL